MSSTIQIRVKPERKEALEKIAEAFHESLSTFMLNSSLLRAELGQGPSSAKDPFVSALEKMTGQQRPFELDGTTKERVESGRKRRLTGKEKLKPISEAREILKKMA